MKGFFSAVMLVGVAFGACWLTYNYHEPIQKVVNRIPPDTGDNIKKGFVSLANAVKAIINDK
jgi:hypothetical protein